MNDKSGKNKRLINIHELSELLGICVNTIYSWVSEKKIPYTKMGRLLRFDSEKINRWIDEQGREVKH